MSLTVEKCFDDAEESGVLQIIHKGLKQFPACVDDYDLLDVITLDISRNRFAELPQEILSFVMMEKMSCSYNYLRNLPDLSHLNALSVIDIRQNQFQSLPIHLCSLPLKILNVSHNRITAIPSEIGLLSKLQSLDLSCNELTNLPSTLGDLLLLGSLNIRRNQIVALPDELSKLKNLMKLDFSCNQVSAIPPAFRLISSLIELDLTNNPLTSPPAQICLKGRLHIVKYLSIAAQQQEKRWTLMKENGLVPSPSSSSLESSNSPTTDNQLLEVDSNLDQGRKRASTIKNDEDSMEELDSMDSVHTNENVFEQSISPPPPPPQDAKPRKVQLLHEIVATSPQEDVEQKQAYTHELAEHIEKENQKNPPVEEEPPVKAIGGMVKSPSFDKPKVPRKPASFNEKHKLTLEKGKLTPQPFKTRLPTPSSPSGRLWSSGSESGSDAASMNRLAVRNLGNTLKSNDEELSKSKSAGERLDDLAARKEQLLKNKEEILKSKQRLELIKAKSIPRDYTAVSPSEPLSPTGQNGSAVGFDGISRRAPLKPRNPQKKIPDGVINFTMRRMFDSAKEEFELLEKLRESIESRLRIKLPDDLPASLSDGIVLCHLVNHLRKGTIPVIHVPSSGVPKLTMPKCQMNVDAFIDACRRAGVEKEDTCTAPDILEEKSPTKLCKTVHSLLLAMGDAPPNIILKQQIPPQSPR